MFQAINETIKSGEDILIREAVPSDAAALRNLKLSYIEGTTTIPMDLDEYKNDEVQEAIMIREYNEQSNSIILVAEHAGHLIGNIDVIGRQRRKLYHTGIIGMGIAYAWHGRGIGTLLMQSVIDWATISPIRLLWLEVYANNAAGRGLYEKMGFQVVGTMPNFFYENGQAIDNIIMQRIIE